MTQTDPGPPPPLNPPTSESVSHAGRIAFNTTAAGLPATFIAGYFVQAYLHPNGQPLPPEIAMPIAAGVTAVAGFTWHMIERWLSKVAN